MGQFAVLQINVSMTDPDTGLTYPSGVVCVVSEIGLSFGNIISVQAYYKSLADYQAGKQPLQIAFLSPRFGYQATNEQMNTASGILTYVSSLVRATLENYPEIGAGNVEILNL